MLENAKMTSLTLRPVQERRHCLGSKIVSRMQEITFFVFKTQLLCLQHKLCEAAYEKTFGKHQRNTDFEFVAIVSLFAYPSNIF